MKINLQKILSMCNAHEKKHLYKKEKQSKTMIAFVYRKNMIHFVYTTNHKAQTAHHPYFEDALSDETIIIHLTESQLETIIYLASGKEDDVFIESSRLKVNGKIFENREKNNIPLFLIEEIEKLKEVYDVFVHLPYRNLKDISLKSIKVMQIEDTYQPVAAYVFENGCFKVVSHGGGVSFEEEFRKDIKIQSKNVDNLSCGFNMRYFKHLFSGVNRVKKDIWVSLYLTKSNNYKYIDTAPIIFSFDQWDDAGIVYDFLLTRVKFNDN